MTAQQSADQLLELWRLQAKLGIKPKQRRLPPPGPDDAFERDLAIIRQVLERA